MQIKDASSAAYDSAFAANRSVEQSTSPAADINFFTSTLAQPATLADNRGRSEKPGLLSEASELLTQSTERMTKSLRALSKKTNERDMREYPSHLSNTLLLTHVLVKGVGKTAQGIEKISNLQ